MRYARAFAALLALALLAADSPEERKAQLRQQCEALRIALLEKATAEMNSAAKHAKAAKSGKINPQISAPGYQPKTKTYVFRSREGKDQYIAEQLGNVGAYELAKQRYEAGELPAPSLENSVAVGAIGGFTYEEKATMRPFSLKVFQVVDDRNAMIDFKGETIWLSGIDASKWTEDRRVLIAEVFEIVGTKRYTTTDGATRTVLEARPFALPK